MAIIIKTIKKLPKTCSKCKSLRYEYDNIFNLGGCVCGIENSYVFCDKDTQKPDWCPLGEVK